MPDVSKIRLPDSTEVNIKDSRIVGVDSAPTSGSENIVTSGGIYDSLRTDKIKPITNKTFTGVLATSSNYNTLFPFFRVIPTVWNYPVIVEYRFLAYVPDHETYYISKHECKFVFFMNTVPAYRCENFIGNTSYKPIYYNSLMRCKEAYKTIGHLVGINYYSSGDTYSRSCTSSSYARSFVVEITRIENCTIEWLNTCDTVASTVEDYVAGTTHEAIGNYNATTQGDTHTGDANTNTVGYNLRYPTEVRKMSATLYRYRICFTSADDTKWVPANTSSSTNATASRTVNQTPINPFGTIAYYATTTTVNANATVGASNMWTQYDLTLGYSFNRTGAALVLTYPAPVYIKCAPQVDGSAIIDADTPYVQALPSTNDGKIYIRLGQATSATAITLENDHPIYYHDGTRIRLWTGPVQSVGDVYLGEIVETIT